MSSIPLAAMVLAAASLTAPCPVRHRLPRAAARSASRAWVATSLMLACAVGVAVVAPPTVVLVVGMVTTGFVVWQRRRRRAEQRRREGLRVAAALELLIGELRIGAHPVQAFAVAAAESPGPVGESLRAVAARARLGADVVAGLRSAAGQSTVPAYWLRLAVFWELAVQHGLPMSVLMRAAHRDIIDRQRFSAQMHAALAGARATAVILAGLPVLGALLGQLVGADPLLFLLGRGMGGVLLVVGVGLDAAGLMWANRIIDRLVR